MTESHYEVLGVCPDASPDEIERAYRREVKQHHPDRSDSPHAYERFRRIQDAKETLLNTEKRRRYDRRRRAERSFARENSNATSRPSRSSSADSESTRTRTRRDIHHEYGRGDSLDASSSTDARQRWSTAHRRIGDVLSVYRRPTRWLSSRLNSISGRRQLLTAIATSPTFHRLGAAVALMQFVSWAGYSSGTIPPTPRVGLAVVLSSLCVSYGAYPTLRSSLGIRRDSSDRLDRHRPVSLWSIAMLLLCGFGLLGIAALRGAPTAGVTFAYVSSIYAGLVLLSGWVVATLLLTLLNRTFTQQFRLEQSVRFGARLGTGGALVVLFTRFSGEAALPTVVESTIGRSVERAPWSPDVVIGPLYLGTFLNVLVALVLVPSLLGGIGTALQYLLTVPSADRYERRYPIRPTVWNLAAVVAPVTLVWMTLAGVPAVDLWVITLDVPLALACACLFPPALVVFYLLRRRAVTSPS